MKGHYAIGRFDRMVNGKIKGYGVVLLVDRIFCGCNMLGLCFSRLFLA
jgi:hypothetical protein